MNTLMRTGFLAAAAMNIGGVLTFSKFFTNDTINLFDPIVMSNFGLFMIVIWGLAYAGGAFIEGNTRWLAGAFAIEKAVYVFIWSNWMLNNSLAEVYEADLFAGIFYSIYGLNDIAFMLFFAWAFWAQSPEKKII